MQPLMGKFLLFHITILKRSRLHETEETFETKTGYPCYDHDFCGGGVLNTSTLTTR